MPTSPSRRRRTLVENALLAELTRRLGGSVRVSEREVVALPRGLVAEMFVEEVPEKTWVLRLSGADYAVPSPATPVVDEEKALFPPSFVTCSECKFSFERVHGDECPVCKLQEVESTPAARGEVGRLNELIEVLTRNYERAQAELRALRTSLTTSAEQYEAERGRHVSTRAALDSARAALASKSEEVEALRAELQLVASGRKTISAKPSSLSENRPRETFDLIAKALGGVVESYDTAGVYPGGGSELRTRYQVSFVLPVRFASPFDFAEIAKMREENAMLKSVVANLPGGLPL